MSDLGFAKMFRLYLKFAKMQLYIFLGFQDTFHIADIVFSELHENGYF